MIIGLCVVMQFFSIGKEWSVNESVENNSNACWAIANYANSTWLCEREVLQLG